MLFFDGKNVPHLKKLDRELRTAGRVALSIFSIISLCLIVSLAAYYAATCSAAATDGTLQGVVIGLALADAMCAVAILDTVGRTSWRKNNN